jgi:hypothetical protein
MPQIIPVASALESDRFETELMGIRVTVVARWNERAPNLTSSGEEASGAWFLDLYDEKGVPIFYGARVSCGTLIARWARHALTRLGCFVAADSSGRGDDPGRWDLGERVQLLHYTEDEVLGIRAEVARS